MRSLTLSLFLVVVSAAQNPQPDPPKAPETPEVQVTPTPGERKELARLSKAMQGLWVLRELDWPQIQGVTSEFRGFCLVSENHLSFEVHIGLRNSRDVLNDSLLDSGMWRFELAEGGRLILTSLIGTFLDKANHVVFREPGTQYRYEVIAEGDQMVWRKSDGQRMSFIHLTDGSAPRVDAFGRTVKDKKGPEKKEPGKKGGEEPPKEQDD
jgi:hypothetical protein